MTFLECCSTVRAEGLRLIRPRSGADGQYDIKPPFTGQTAGWIFLDAMTAGVVCQIYEKLSPERQEKFCKLPVHTILKFCWRVVNEL